MHAQAQTRFRKRIPCQVRVEDRRHSGLVLNLSQGGLYVQTSAGANPGTDLQIELALGPGAPVAIGAKVVWKRVVAPNLRTIAQGGIGLSIRRAPEPFYTLLMRLQSGHRASAPAPERTVDASVAAAVPGRFRVRIQRSDGPRSRTLTVEAPSGEAARELALCEAGSGWTVLEVERS